MRMSESTQRRGTDENLQTTCGPAGATEQLTEPEPNQIGCCITMRAWKQRVCLRWSSEVGRSVCVCHPVPSHLMLFPLPWCASAERSMVGEQAKFENITSTVTWKHVLSATKKIHVFWFSVRAASSSIFVLSEDWSLKQVHQEPEELQLWEMIKLSLLMIYTAYLYIL